MFDHSVRHWTLWGGILFEGVPGSRWWVTPAANVETLNAIGVVYD